MRVKKGWVVVIIIMNAILLFRINDSYMNQKIRVPRLIYIPEKDSLEIIKSLNRPGVKLLPIDLTHRPGSSIKGMVVRYGGNSI